MCRHCERLIEDAEDKPLVHAFMEKTAEKLNRNFARMKPHLYKPITADDIDIKVEVRARISNGYTILKEMWE